MNLQPNIITKGLTFEPESHTYRFNGRELVGTTNVIKSMGLMEGLDFMTDEHRERGTAVHTGIHYIQKGTLDDTTVHPTIAPYLTAYNRFMRENEVTVFASEITLAHEKLGFAGTLDMLAWMNAEPFISLIDFKTGAFSWWHMLQMAAYAELIAFNRAELALDAVPGPIPWRIVELRRDESYKVHDCAQLLAKMSLTQARSVFLSALNCYKFKENFHSGNVADRD